MKRRFYLLSAILVLSVFALTGCGAKKNADPAASNEPAVSQDNEDTPDTPDTPDETPDSSDASEAPDDIEVQETEDIPEIEIDFDDL